MVILLVIVVIYELVCFLRAVFSWDSYSWHFPRKHILPWKRDITKWVYEAYGDRAVRKYVIFESLFIMVLGICTSVALVKDNAQRGRIDGYPQVHQGESVAFAGGELTLGEMEINKSFTAKRFNVDSGRYEEVEVKVNTHSDTMLLVKTTLTNNSDDTLVILQENLKCYLKPNEGHNINGRTAINGYLYITDEIELAQGESMPIFFWLTLSKEQRYQAPTVMVLEYGKTGCRIGGLER